ncbi:hypothetical protein TTHERM_00295770 (macronuclear) [Tetrahymena thermophila SB210]|uniref:Uncharacterized protein n=1 Tax=Tetrahymena thermophila (strain SB210) TaxID=312017 RepID=I7M0Y9_TETTS|nr:hypothetical protein TTHERM_00295770 [Tetrahymena thermophila SB210]EAR92964.2 hypothetical protein TTHERM_00295770 [Tetrahymena thermophila SB210]|eukprot:XP_001013209.2 hypothetical protein TTHERM_00295770 [Tetrahymena thermophila SB210]
MEDQNITPGQKRIKSGEYIFYILEQSNNTIKMECENRRTHQKYSSENIVLKKLKPETFSVALEGTQSNIKAEIINADAQMIIKVNVNHEFLPLISEEVHLVLICDSENDPTLQVLKNMNIEVEEIREEMKDICISLTDNLVQDFSSSSLSTSALKVADFKMLNNGNYIVSLNYHIKSSSNEPQITVNATFNDGNKNEEKVYNETVNSTFSYTGYTTFQNIKFIINRNKASQKNLEISLQSSAQTAINNVNISLCKAY